jgi:hypothetical protein
MILFVKNIISFSFDEKKKKKNFSLKPRMTRLEVKETILTTNKKEMMME